MPDTWNYSVNLSVLLFVFQDRIVLCSSGWPRTLLARVAFNSYTCLPVLDSKVCTTMRDFSESLLTSSYCFHVLGISGDLRLIQAIADSKLLSGNVVPLTLYSSSSLQSFVFLLFLWLRILYEGE